MQSDPGNKKILILTHEFLPFPGGVATYVSELALAAHQIGHRITVLAPDYGEKLFTQDLEHFPFKVIRYHGGLYGHIKGLPMLIWRTWCHADLKRYDLIHAADWPYVMALSFINKFRCVPFIATVHGTEILRTPRSKQVRALQVRDLFIRADKIFANSQFTRKLLLGRFPGVDEANIKVTLLAANSYWFQPVNPVDAQQARRTHNIPSDHQVILTVSRLEERKGHRLVLQALQCLPLSLKDAVTYVITGERANQAYPEELHRLAGGCGVNVVFIGAVPKEDVRALYNTSSIYCMPGEPNETRVEGFGLVYLEAAAQGLPSIASNLAAIPEVVRDGVSGILVPPMDVRALAGALEQLLGNPELLKRLKRGAREWAETFSWKRCAEESYGT